MRTQIKTPDQSVQRPSTEKAPDNPNILFPEAVIDETRQQGIIQLMQRKGKDTTYIGNGLG